MADGQSVSWRRTAASGRVKRTLRWSSTCCWRSRATRWLRATWPLFWIRVRRTFDRIVDKKWKPTSCYRLIFLICLDQKVRRSSVRMRPILAPSSTGQELQHKVSRHSSVLSTPRLFLQIYIHLQLLYTAETSPQTRSLDKTLNSPQLCASACVFHDGLVICLECILASGTRMCRWMEKAVSANQKVKLSLVFPRLHCSKD